MIECRGNMTTRHGFNQLLATIIAQIHGAARHHCRCEPAHQMRKAVILECLLKTVAGDAAQHELIMVGLHQIALVIPSQLHVHRPTQ